MSINEVCKKLEYNFFRRSIETTIESLVFLQILIQNIYLIYDIDLSKSNIYNQIKNIEPKPNTNDLREIIILTNEYITLKQYSLKINKDLAAPICKEIEELFDSENIKSINEKLWRRSFDQNIQKLNNLINGNDYAKQARLSTPIKRNELPKTPETSIVIKNTPTTEENEEEESRETYIGRLLDFDDN